jgi:hypothetical protein
MDAAEMRLKAPHFYLTSVVSYCFASDISAFLRIGRAGLR